jgi:hypothetical protein
LLKLAQYLFDAVDRGEDQRHRIAGHRQTVTKPPHHCLGRVRQRFQSRQAKKTAGPFDGVNETKNIIEPLRVVRILLEAHEFHVDDIEIFVCLGEKFAQQVIHRGGFQSAARPIRRHPARARPVCCQTV